MKEWTVAAGAENRNYPLYMFDVDFDALAVPDEPEDEEKHEPPPPTYSAEELAAAREDGLSTGRAEGIAQSNAGFEHQIAETLAGMAQTMTTLADAQHAANEETARVAVQLAVTTAAKLLPEYARRHGMAEIEAFVGQCLSSLYEGPAVTIRVAEDAAAEISERITPIAQQSGFDGTMKIVGDPGLDAADCRVEWDDGGMERNRAALMREIDLMVEGFLAQHDETSPQDAAVGTAPAQEMPPRDAPSDVNGGPAEAHSAPPPNDDAVEEAKTADVPKDDTHSEPGGTAAPLPPVIEVAGEVSSVDTPPDAPDTAGAETKSSDSDDPTVVPDASPEAPVEPVQQPDAEPESGPALPGAVLPGAVDAGKASD